MESRAGQAWVVLQAGLGQALPFQPTVHQPHRQRNRNGPAPQRRHIRSEAARIVAAVDAEAHTEEQPVNNSKEVAEEAFACSK